MNQSNKKHQLASILRQLADFVERGSDQEIGHLLEAASRLVSNPTQRRGNRGLPESNVQTEELQQIANRLGGLRSREEGEAFLRDTLPTRALLEKLARILELPIQRDDNIERLRTKIIETQIGHRLRSDAIQGGSS